MGYRAIAFLCVVMAAAGVFARGTRSIAVSANVTDGVVQGATLTFSPDNGAVVLSNDLYVAKGMADCGPDFALWSNPVKIATIGHNVNSYEVLDITALVGEWDYVRFFLKSTNYAERADGLKILDRIVADGNQALVVTGYKPLGTARFDYEMSLTAMPAQKKFFGVFCARNSGTTPQNTFTSFLHGKEGGGYSWRMDYCGTLTDHDNDLGCAIGTTNRFTAVGTGTSATLANWVNGGYHSVTTLSETVLNQAANPLMLFACYGKNTGDSLSWQAKMAMYSFRATETNSIVHNLLPAKRGSDIGLYDVVDGTLYTSGTSTSFAAGSIESPELVESSEVVKRTGGSAPVVHDELSRPFTVEPTYDAQGFATSARFDFVPSDISITQRVTAVFGSRRVAVTNLPPGAAASFVYEIPRTLSSTCRFEVEPLLPDGYGPLEYMETSARADNSSGQGCFLDTGYTPCGTTAVKAKVACLPLASDKGNWTLFCARNKQDAGSDNLVLALFALNSIKFRFDYASVKGSDTASGAFTVGSPFSVECRVPGGYTVTQSDGSSTTYDSQLVYANYVAAGPMRLFASYKDGLKNVGNAEKMRVYEYRVRDADGEQLTLLPARNSSGDVGLWDFKSGTFRTSSGTVPFSAGDASSISAFLQTTEAYRVRCRGVLVISR